MKWGISKATQAHRTSQQKATTSAVSEIPSSLPIHAPYSLRNCVSFYTLRRITRTKRHPAQPTASSRCFVSSFSCQWLTHLLLGVRRKVFVFTVPTQKNKQTSCFSLLFIYLLACLLPSQPWSRTVNPATPNRPAIFLFPSYSSSSFWASAGHVTSVRPSWVSEEIPAFENAHAC